MEWIAITFSKESSQFRDQTRISCISCTGKWILYHWATWEAPPAQHWPWTAPWRCQADACLGAFELNISSAWNTLLLKTSELFLHFFLDIQSCSHGKVFLIHSKIASVYTRHIWLPFFVFLIHQYIMHSILCLFILLFVFFIRIYPRENRGHLCLHHFCIPNAIVVLSA